MSAADSKLPVCQRCGCSSAWIAAFGSIKDGTRTLICCPACKKHLSDRHARAMFWGLPVGAGKKLPRQSAAYAELLRGLVAVAESKPELARAHHATAKSLHATAAPLRLLEARLPSR
jgi:hypothetical protein